MVSSLSVFYSTRNSLTVGKHGISMTMSSCGVVCENVSGFDGLRGGGGMWALRTATGTAGRRCT